MQRDGASAFTTVELGGYWSGGEPEIRIIAPSPTTCWWCQDIMEAPHIQSNVPRPMTFHHVCARIGGGGGKRSVHVGRKRRKREKRVARRITVFNSLPLVLTSLCPMEVWDASCMMCSSGITYTGGMTIRMACKHIYIQGAKQGAKYYGQAGHDNCQQESFIAPPSADQAYTPHHPPPPPHCQHSPHLTDAKQDGSCRLDRERGARPQHSAHDAEGCIVSISRERIPITTQGEVRW